MHLTYVALHEMHGCMVYTERTKMAAVPCGTSHASAVSGYSKMCCKKLVTRLESHASTVSAQDRRIALYQSNHRHRHMVIVQELCESRGGRPGLSVLTSLLVSVDVKIYSTMLRHWSQLVPNMSTDI